MQKPAVVVAGGDTSFRSHVTALLLRRGCRVGRAAGPDGLLDALEGARPSLVIVAPSRGQATEWLAVARQIREHDQRLPIILVIEDSSEDLAIAALRSGLTDYLKHPVSSDELAASIGRCLPASPAPHAPEAAGGVRPMVGASPKIREIKAYALRVAVSDANVLITGETGTGKELVAELIHGHSARRHRPFVSVNCAAIPESLVESELFGHERGAFTGAHAPRDGKLRLADGGSVFFDEIGDMSLPAQAKILRTIENREVDRLGGARSVPIDVRVIAATNQDLERLTEERKFRADLYFRVSVARIHLPPLRERREDIPRLLDHYIGEFNLRFGREVEGFTDEALERLLEYTWPGNVRELRNLLEAVFVNLPSRRITLVELPESFRRRLDEVARLPGDDRARLLSALFATNWNKSKAAERLHWSRMTVYRKIAKYRLDARGAGRADPAPVIETDPSPRGD